jgi:hypothetical protein
VCKCRRVQLWGWWWPVGPKLDLDQIDSSTSPGNYGEQWYFNILELTCSQWWGGGIFLKKFILINDT